MEGELEDPNIEVMGVWISFFIAGLDDWLTPGDDLAVLVTMDDGVLGALPDDEKMLCMGAWTSLPPSEEKGDMLAEEAVSIGDRSGEAPR